MLLIKRILPFLFCLTCAGPVWAHPGIQDYGYFKRIPVLDNGRLKPLDTFARSILTQFSGHDHYERQGASAWLASLFFDSATTMDEKFFLINDPDVAQALGITPAQGRRYSPRQLEDNGQLLAQLDEAAEKIPEKQRSVAENEIIRVYDNLNLYAGLVSSFLFACPNDDFTVHGKGLKAQLGLPSNQDRFSFLALALRAEDLSHAAQGLSRKSPSEYTPKEMEIFQLTTNLLHWSQEYRNMPFTVIPFGQDGMWLSPWDALDQGFGDAATRSLLILWSRMAEAYAQGDGVAFNTAAGRYLDQVHALCSRQDIKQIDKFPLELFYQQVSPFTWSIMFYILAFLFFVASFSSAKTLWYNLGLCSIIAGFIPHLLGLMMRIIIMGRPPVSSLYETFIFVSLITVLLGLMIEYYNRQWLGIVTAAISGTALLFIANKYSAEGDTLKVLVAVLNSNFWLATHVTTITMGYGATCVAGVLGHTWLLQAACKKDKEILDKTYKTTLGILGLALTLTFLGTNLGGIWADQSWGRFWGWDPKENGALMIVLWTALLFHAKFDQMIGPRGLAIGAVIGMMVVMWAWFGVNLLSVGLHSYGFTSGIANALIAYAVCETIFLVVTAFLTFRVVPAK